MTSEKQRYIYSLNNQGAAMGQNEPTFRNMYHWLNQSQEGSEQSMLLHTKALPSLHLRGPSLLSLPMIRKTAMLLS